MQNWILNEFKPGLVSVIIPTYNRAGLLKEAVMSVFEQTYRPIECIVVDDGSTDHSAEVIEELQKLQGAEFTLKYIIQQNAGSQVARNTGTKESTGEFIQYLDSDDLLYKEKLAKQVNYLQKKPNCDAVFGDWNSGFTDNYSLVKGYLGNDFIKQVITNERPIHTLSFLMRKRLVEQIGAWDVTIKRMQEVDFQLRGILAGGRFHYQEFTCGLWRYHENERIHNQTSLDDIIFFYQKWEVILKKEKLFTEEMANKIASWYMWFISQSKNQGHESLKRMLEEAVRLNPFLSFYQSKKMRFLRMLLGNRNALHIWFIRYRCI